MTASLVDAVARTPDGDEPNLTKAIIAGLRAMRDLNEFGHGLVKDGEPDPDGFPLDRCVKVLKAEPNGDDVVEVKLAWTHEDILKEGWSILEKAQVPPSDRSPSSMLGLARLVVLNGPKAALRGLPHAVFRQLTAIDRSEIEALRRIRGLMQEYEADPKPPRPLCIGVFGPPGAGKSFGVKQLANEIFGEKAWLEFNLSQFSEASELLGPFHRARDRVLEGVTPVVFWDEFDSQDLKWLQFLIAPMQDSHFQDHQLTHAVGKAVFVFAGGTAPTFEAFGTDRESFRPRKGPDFVSRLDAYFDVTGPNPRTGGSLTPDLSYPVRRALIVRHILAGPSERRLDIDSDLLNALLLVPFYKHGSRSLENLTTPVKSRDGGPIRRTGLPAPRDLGMHVDEVAFQAILNLNTDFRMAEAVNVQAAAVHAAYLERKERVSEQVAYEVKRDFEDLEPTYKEENRAAARRTADVLALIGMGVAGKGAPNAVPRDVYDAHIEHHLERLAEAEHDGWMAQRLANGWTHAVKTEHRNRRHECLKPYADLDGKFQENDRSMVKGYWDRVSKDFTIVWLADQVSGPPSKPKRPASGASKRKAKTVSAEAKAAEQQ